MFLFDKATSLNRPSPKIREKKKKGRRRAAIGGGKERKRRSEAKEKGKGFSPSFSGKKGCSRVGVVRDAHDSRSGKKERVVERDRKIKKKEKGPRGKRTAVSATATF